VVDIPVSVQKDDSFYAVFGHFMGAIAGDRIPVVAGLEVRPSEDQLKAMGASAASSGAVGLFHITGVTPEAPSLEAAFQGGDPAEVLDVKVEDLRKARRDLTTADDAKLDMVVVGSPHFSIEEFKNLASLVCGKRLHKDLKFLITTSRNMTRLAKQDGCLAVIEDFGAHVTVDTCILASPMLPPGIKRVMTNSAKYAYYAPGMLDVKVTFGSLEECVRSAVEGRVVMEESW
jgi:predicted aconitase